MRDATAWLGWVLLIIAIGSATGLAVLIRLDARRRLDNAHHHCTRYGIYPREDS